MNKRMVIMILMVFGSGVALQGARPAHARWQAAPRSPQEQEVRDYAMLQVLIKRLGAQNAQKLWDRAAAAVASAPAGEVQREAGRGTGRQARHDGHRGRGHGH